MAPDKIFLQVCCSCDLDETCENCKLAKLLEGGEVTWSDDRIYENDEEYIRKAALLKKIDEIISHLSDGSLTGYYESLAYKDIRELVESM